MTEPVFGIDLGTTHSVLAWVHDGVPEVIDIGNDGLLPSVVGFDLEDRLRVGVEARNQLAAFPDRTVASIKRRMGDDVQVPLGGRRLSPPEISALILKELARLGEQATGVPVRRVVITVPAFFRDAQRQATRMAGEIAGLEVVRILNEPTAAALAFGADQGGRSRTQVVYDLGGGTFDVSVVRADADIVEVLSSHGDVELGGDDFDRLIVREWLSRLPEGQDRESDRMVHGRLLLAAEAAKRRLTEEVSTKVSEPFLYVDRQGVPCHLDQELTRQRFEELISPLLERTLTSVHEALKRSAVGIDQVEDVLLVGGSTRSPVVGQLLAEMFGRLPRRDVHPDLCVALGAALAGARMAGQRTSRVLVDVTPYSFGPSHLDMVDGMEELDAFTPVIEAGTPLPVTRSASYFTVHDEQEAWDVRIFQGESRYARDNVLVGRFSIEGLCKVPAGNEVVCRMHLDLDGILTVEAIEKRTGLKKLVVIDGASAQKSEAELETLRRQTRELFEQEENDEALPSVDHTMEPQATVISGKAVPEQARIEALLTEGAKRLWKMAPSDQEDYQRLAGILGRSLVEGLSAEVEVAAREMQELLEYVDET